MYTVNTGRKTFQFENLKTLLGKATPLRSGDQLAGIASESAVERVAAQFALADVPLRYFLEEPLIPYELDEVTRLIFDTFDKTAFSVVSSLTVGDFRNWLLSDEVNGEVLATLAPGLMPEMVAAV